MTKNSLKKRLRKYPTFNTQETAIIMQTFQKDLNDSLKIKKMPRMVEHTPIVTQTREIRVFKTQFEESVQKKKEVVSQTSNYSKEYCNETETPGRLGSRGCSSPCGLQRQPRVVDGMGEGGGINGATTTTTKRR